MIRPTAIINLKYFKDNIRYINSLLNDNTRIMPVIKANAYGHGLNKIAHILQKEGVEYVCVATIDEVLEVLQLNLGFKILHLGKYSFEHLEVYSNNNVLATINTKEDIRVMGENNNLNFNVHLKIDTGMNRMGCNISDIENILCLSDRFSNVNIKGIYSHLACSENKQKSHNQIQLNLFKKTIDKYKERGYLFHILNSGGMLNFQNFHMDFVRSGITIYGVTPKGSENKYLKPVMKFIAPIVLIKEVTKGDKIGYGCTYKASKNMKIGIVQCGYADGVPLIFDNRGFVFYKKKKIPIIGRVSMDLTCIDLTDIISINEGDPVVFWGDVENKKSSLEYISEVFDTMPYIFLTSLSNRVMRVYIEE